MAKGKKQEDPNKVAQRKAERVAFVKANPNLAPEVARQRFYVQTRAAELEAAGKDVDRAALRQKFQTGGVTREGFYTPADVNRFNAAKDNSNSLADSKSVVTPPVVSNAPSTPVAPKATPTKITGGGKTPSSSYQAPQTTTSLGQVVQPPTSYMDKQPGTPVRGGEPGRRVNPPAIVRPQGTPVRGGEPRPPVWKSGEPVIGDVTSGGRITENGIVYRQPGVNEGREFTAAVNRVFPQAPANPKALQQQRGARLRSENNARINASNPLRAAQQAKVDAGFVEAPYDWTNLYKATAGSLTLAAEIAGTRFGGPVGGALATGATFNATERLGNLLEQKGALGGTPGDPGRFKGKTDLKSAAIVGGASLAGNLVGIGAQKLIPKIKPAWRALQEWADDTPVQPVTPWKEGGAGSPGISTGIKPRTPWMEGTKTTGVSSPRRVSDPKTTTPKSIETPAPVSNPKFTPETKTESGLVIPATTNRTPAAERNPVFEKALEDAGVVSKPLPPESLDQTKKNIEAAMQEDGVKPYDQMTPQEKRKFTIAQKKALQQNIEIKAPDTVPASKQEPVPNVTPEPASTEIKPLSVVRGNSRADQMRGHPSMGTPPEPPKLSVVTDEAAPNVPPAKRPPTQRPNESDATYAKRLDAWRVANEDGVFKAPAGFERNRSSISYQEKAMTRIEGGMSRTNRSRTTAFISDPGMSPEGFPVQMEGESVMQFNIRASEFLKSRGKTVPQAPDNSFLAQGTPEPVSLDTAKAALATENIPPRPPGLKNAAWDPETQQWRSRSKNKAGEYKFVEKRTVYATEEERQAGTAASELKKQQNRKASRAAKSVEVKVKAETIAASGGPDAEYGPFMFGGEPIGRSRVTLTPGELPDWAQANTSLTTKPLSEAENVWLNRTLNPDEEAFFRELGNARKRSTGRLTTRSTREATPADVEEYLRKMRGMRHSRSAGELEEGIDFGIDAAPLSDTQRALEKEIEQVLGSDALTALKNIALRRNTPPLTQNIRGLESLADIKASGEPLINKLVVRQPTPSASGRLREQAAAFFNAQGRVKGVSGADRIRTWNRLTQSDWFRKLQESEPTFANFLREQNESLGRSIKPTLEGELAAMPKPMNLRQKRWAMESFIGKKEKAAAAVEFDRAIPDTGLGAYDLKGEELVEGVKAGDFKKGTTVQQRAQAAEIERKLKAETSLLRRIVSEDQAAFGDVNYFNRGFEQGQQLDPMIDSNVLKDYGIVDEKGFTNINQSQFNIARRELEGDIVLPNDSRNEAAAAAFEAERDRIFEAFPGKANKEQRKKALAELAQRNEPAGLPDPFAQRFGETLPKDYTRVIPENSGKVWYDGSWVTPQKAADKAVEQAAKQAQLRLKVEESWQQSHSAFDEGRPWMEAAKARAIAARSVKPEPTPMFDRFGPVRSEASIREEVQRLASLENKAAKARAQAPRGMTAQEIRYEMQNPVLGPPRPAGSKTYDYNLASMREEEARFMREISEEGFDSFEMNLGDYFK